MIPLLWCDIETTGLDPARHCPIEVGLIATNEALEEEARTSILIRPVPGFRWEPVAREMHRASGLLAALEGVETTIAEADEFLAEWIVDHAPGRPLAGSNPGFDRAFLASYFPDAHAFFHYRQFDINALYMFFEIKKDKGTRPHRAIDDLVADITVLRQLAKRR